MPVHSDAYLAALRFIRERGDYAHGHISSHTSGPHEAELGLLRTRALLDRLGAPDRHYPIIHIAGSKGKGSTSAFLESIARKSGYRTGLYISPHLHSFRERISIDGNPIDEVQFATLAQTVERETIELERDRPELGRSTAFELLTVMGLLAFAQNECNLAVVEVGLGGKLDATNVVEPAVTVITRLDFEHTGVLGDSIVSIATNKAGIIEPGIPVITTDQLPDALTILRATAEQLGAPILVRDEDFSTRGSWREFVWQSDDHYFERLRSGMAGPHQLENASLAIAAWCAFDRQPDADSIRQGILDAFLPGRFERVTIEDRHWILDGAHTPVAARVLAQEVLAETGKPVVSIVGLLSDKHSADFFRELTPAIAISIVTEPRNPRAIPTSELLAVAARSISEYIAVPELAQAIELALTRTRPGMSILITGSLTLVAEARELLGLATADPRTT